MKKQSREYLAPEVEVMKVSLDASLLTSSTNQIAQPAGYTGSGEGFDW